IDGDDTNHGAILVFYQIYRKPFIQENGLVFEVTLIKGMQKRVAGPVCRRTSPCSLATFTEVFGLSTEGTLIDAATLGTGEWKPHVLQFETASGPTEHMYSIASWSPI